MSKLDTLGEKIKRRMSTLEGLKGTVESEKHDIGVDLRFIWDALKRKETVNGFNSTKEWAEKFAKVTTRYCQLLLRGERGAGSAKKRTTVRIPTLKPGDVVRVDYEGERAKWTLTSNPVGGLHLIKVKEEKPAKSQEEKKPIKHAKNPKTLMSWCHTSLNQNNTAYQARHATCPYCIEAHKAGVPVRNPETWRRYYQKELADRVARLKDHERMVENCLPEHRGKHYDSSVKYIPELREEIVELERKLAAVNEVKTPEQAVEAAKKAAAEREAEQKRLQSMKPTFNQLVAEHAERESAFFDTLPEDMPMREKSRLYKEHLKLSEPAKALAAAVGSADVPTICDNEEAL